MPEPCFLRSKLFARHGLHGVFSLRTGGVSPPPFDSMNLADDTGDVPGHVQQNLGTLLRESGIARKPHRARQVHGREVLRCSGEGRVHNDAADILVSSDGSVLGVRVADCAPVLLAEPERGLLAAVHAGWRGTAMDVAGHAVRALEARGANTSNIIASIGPCIGPCCFEIGDDAADALRNSCPEADGMLIEKKGGLHSDLAGINRLQLLHAGLTPANIEQLRTSTAGCTCCHSREFFSYRRDGKQSGRHLAIVAPMVSA